MKKAKKTTKARTVHKPQTEQKERIYIDPHTGRKTAYKFGTLKVGRSFLFPAKEIVKTRNNAVNYGYRQGMSFSTVKLDNDLAKCTRTA